MSKPKVVVDKNGYLRINGKVFFRFVEENGRNMIEVQRFSGAGGSRHRKYDYLDPVELINAIEKVVA